VSHNPNSTPLRITLTLVNDAKCRRLSSVIESMTAVKIACRLCCRKNSHRLNTFLSVPLLYHSMGLIIKSLASVCQSVCKHSCGHKFDSILIFCTVIWGPKSKIEFVWDKKSDNTFLYFTPNFKKFALRPTGTSKRYNSVPVKDNCALCLPTPLFSGSGNLTVLFKFTFYRPLLP